jgi:hypothetical protein
MMLYNMKFEETIKEYKLHTLTSYDIFRLFIRLYLTKLSPAMSTSVESFLNNSFTEETMHSEMSEETVHPETSDETMHSETSYETMHSEMLEETVHPETSDETMHSETSDETMHSETSDETMRPETSEETMHPETSEEKRKNLGINKCDKILNIGAHIRTGGDGYWNDPARIPLDHTVLFADKAVQICLEYGCKKCLFFVSSDAQRAKNIFQRTISFAEKMLHGVELRTVSMDGPILHLDRSAFDDADEKTKMMTFIEWMVLRKMDYLVLSQSGFSETAAWAETRRSWRSNGENFVSYDSVVGHVRMGDW